MIYLVVGNDVSFPEGVSADSNYLNPQLDHLLPNPHDGEPDHRVGYILRTDPEGKNWEVIAGGFRNQVDIAFNAAGEMFTWDADMEWDLGQPWYRPTRINHIIPGGEYGWRSGTGKWPEYYADSLPATLNTGLGSPTGMVSGSEGKFPERFRDVLFAADWQNGRILLIDMIPNGATYTCTSEVFLEGGPLNVCDMQFGPDGALYFITGGVGSQTGLYRVTPDPDMENTSKLPEVSPQQIAHGEEQRALRRKLEEYQTSTTDDIGFLWSQLKSPDRWLRFSARVALEKQEPANWRSLVLNETDPEVAITGLIALARKGSEADQPEVFQALLKISPDEITVEQFADLLRAYQLCFLRLGSPTEKQKELLRNRLSSHFPSRSSNVNHLLGELLVYVGEESFVSRAIPLLKMDLSQEEEIRVLAAC
ncbi:MAG: hypothetical protein R3C11_02115 [Planctomycetaceae bacterium]